MIKIFKSIHLKPALFICLVVFCLSYSAGVAVSDETKAKSADTIDAMGNIEHHDLDEASGLAFSTKNQGIIWSHNDSGNDPVIYSMSESGRNMGCFLVEESDNLDWEDMASFKRQGLSYLMLADTGDNLELRGEYSLNIIQEPDIKKEDDNSKCEKAIKPEKIIRFTFPDGSHDCEASAYDPFSDSFLLVSKRTSPPVLYEVPFSSLSEGVVTARKICEVNLTPNPSESEKNIKIPEKTMKVTGMDISRDGLSMVILTYGDAFLFKKKSLKDSWKSSVSAPPKRITLLNYKDKRLTQREAVCFTPDAKSIFVTTENKPSEIFRFKAR